MQKQADWKYLIAGIIVSVFKLQTIDNRSIYGVKDKNSITTFREK